MQDAPRYDDVVAEVAAFLEERLAFAVAAGIPEERSASIPGIGFGKTPDQNLELLRGLDAARRARPPGAGRALAEERRSRGSLGDPRHDGSASTRLGRRRGRGVRPRRDALPRARRPAARRGARGRGRGRAGSGRGMTIELHGHRAARLPRRARAGAARGPALPRRPRARPSTDDDGGRDRPDRGRRRLPRRRRDRRARSRTRAPTTCSRRSRRAIADALLDALPARARPRSRAQAGRRARAARSSTRPSSSSGARLARRASRDAARPAVRRVERAAPGASRRGRPTGPRAVFR